ncbi:MAG: hypothetical protein US51_C0003G0001, partial [Microgenomates group bacterium GW2011_GWA2_37_6]
DEFETSIIDEFIEDIDFNADVDLIGISISERPHFAGI